MAKAISPHNARVRWKSGRNINLAMVSAFIGKSTICTEPIAWRTLKLTLLIYVL